MNEAGQMQGFRHLATSVSLAALLFCAVGIAQAQPAPAPAVPAPAAAPSQDNPAADTVDAIRARGRLLCGVSPSTPGFAAQEGRAGWRGLDVDYCRAVASAILGDPAKVQFVPVPAADRFEMLRRGRFDILARGTTKTLDRDTTEGVLFVGITYYWTRSAGRLGLRSVNLGAKGGSFMRVRLPVVGLRDGAHQLKSLGIGMKINISA